jgi:hypothetical protein
MFGANRSLGVVAWLMLPVVFIALVVTVLAGADYLLFGRPGRPVELSTLLFGAAAGLSVATAGNVRWPKAGLRRGLYCGYPVMVLGTGVVTDGTLVPAVLAGVLGLPAITAVAAWCLIEQPVTQNPVPTDR